MGHCPVEIYRTRGVVSCVKCDLPFMSIPDGVL